jgi:hypothetical protein
LRKQLALCAWLFVLAVGGAQAQPIYGSPAPFEPPAVLPPYEIMSIVRSTGLAPLTRPMRRGPYYMLVAVDRIGRQMRVVVDAQLGDIVNMRPATATGPFGPEIATLPDTSAAGAYGARSNPDIGAGGGNPNPTPTRPIPNGRAAVTPPPAANASSGSAPNMSPAGVVAPPQARLAVAEPALPPPPPLPRPRPKVALNEAHPAAPTAPPSPPAAKPPAAPATATVPPLADTTQIE